MSMVFTCNQCGKVIEAVDSVGSWEWWVLNRLDGKWPMHFCTFSCLDSFVRHASIQRGKP